MPLKLFPPDRAQGEASYYIRGTHLGVTVRRSAKTDRRATAEQVLKAIKRDIEQGRFAEQPAAVADRSFAAAVVGYLKVCPDGEVAYVNRLLEHFKETPLAAFNATTVDAGEEALFPGRLANFKGSTLNRNYRSPLAAVLHHAAEHELMPWLRVKKYKELKTTRWLEPEQAAGLVAAAADVDAAIEKTGQENKDDSDRRRLAPLLVTLFTTGMRISEAVGIREDQLNLAHREFGPFRTKNGKEYVVHIGDLAFEAIANLPARTAPDQKLFGFRDRHAVKYPLAKACEAVGLVKRDKEGKVLRDANGRAKTTFNPHMARHSFATWLRRQEGMDMKKLMELGRWDNVQSVERYAHVSAKEHAPAIARLPFMKKETA